MNAWKHIIKTSNRLNVKTLSGVSYMKTDHKKLARLIFANRQPTLWRHGIPVLEIVPIEDETDNTIGLSPLTLEPLNADFDGDTVALYALHDKQALQEMYDNAFLKNVIYNDSNHKMLAILRHEALYAAFVLTENISPNVNKEPYFKINSLYDLPEEFEHFNDNLDSAVQIKNKIYSYGLCLFNKWCGFGNVYFDEIINKNNVNDVSKLIYEHVDKNSGKFYKCLNNLAKKLFFFISSTKHSPTLNIEEMLNMTNEDDEKLFQKLPYSNVMLGYLINNALIDRCIDRSDKDKGLYKLYKSGSRFNKTQLARSCINVGYTADAENVVIPKPINTNLMKGMTPQDFFLGSPGSRKGVADKTNATPSSGYLERTLAMGLSSLEIAEEDCYTDKFIEVTIFSKKHAETLVGKYFKDPHNKHIHWNILDYNTAKLFINKKIHLRSPMTCETPHKKICNVCFGSRKFPTKYVGIVAAQCLSERITQLTMRSFHTSGSADLTVDSKIKDFIKDHLLDIEYNSNEIHLKFNTNDFPQTLKTIPGFKDIFNNIVIFDNIKESITNNDAIAVMNSVNELMKVENNPSHHPIHYYEEMMAAILKVGTPYSSFIEILFANMFMVSIVLNDGTEKEDIWRYYPDETIVKKLGKLLLPGSTSKLLGLLYRPNKNTLTDIKLEDITTDLNQLNVYEKIWLGQF